MLSVFFFKQKTEYEMRISYWSADVCSTDRSTLASVGRHRPNLRHLVVVVATGCRRFGVCDPDHANVRHLVVVVATGCRRFGVCDRDHAVRSQATGWLRVRRSPATASRPFTVPWNGERTSTPATRSEEHTSELQSLMRS